MRKAFTVIITCFLLVGCGSSNEGDVNKKDSDIKNSSEISENVEESIEDPIESFVLAFNSNSATPLEFVEEFIPSDKDSGHYRTEFRLGSRGKGKGKSYIYGDTIVDLVISKGLTRYGPVRVYMEGASLEQCLSMIEYASPILYEDITNNELKDVLDYFAENKNGNGYYYPKTQLCVILTGTEEKGYSFMLKDGNS